MPKKYSQIRESNITETMFQVRDLMHKVTDLRCVKYTINHSQYYRHKNARGPMTEVPVELRLSDHSMRPTALGVYKFPLIDIVDTNLWAWPTQSIVDHVLDVVAKTKEKEMPRQKMQTGDGSMTIPGESGWLSAEIPGTCKVSLNYPGGTPTEDCVSHVHATLRRLQREVVALQYPAETDTAPAETGTLAQDEAPPAKPARKAATRKTTTRKTAAKKEEVIQEEAPPARSRRTSSRPKAETTTEANENVMPEIITQNPIYQAAVATAAALQIQVDHLQWILGAIQFTPDVTGEALDKMDADEFSDLVLDFVYNLTNQNANFANLSDVKLKNSHKEAIEKNIIAFASRGGTE